MQKVKSIGFFYLALAVALGALGAHGIKPMVSADTLEVYKTGILYHIVIALVLIAKGELLKKSENILLMFGSVFFSFSLYIITFLKATETLVPSAVGIITPIGGILIIIGLITIGIRISQNK